MVSMKPNTARKAIIMQTALSLLVSQTIIIFVIGLTLSSNFCQEGLRIKSLNLREGKPSLSADTTHS